MIRHLTRLVVWEDESRKTFITAQNGIINSSGNEYEPNGRIRIAHVVDMQPADIVSWRSWLTKEGKIQLFEQVWEPVIEWTPKTVRERYKGAVVDQSTRNDIKKALKNRGIEVYAEDMDRYYNPRTGGYDFSNNGILDFGRCLKLEYEVDPEKKETEFDKSEALVEPGSREMNAVLLELDKGTLSFQISKDNASALNEQILSVFTVAQINTFLNSAIKGKAINCTAVLLDYKNKHYPGYADVNEFSLGW